jgi:formyl-CoA transferase
VNRNKKSISLNLKTNKGAEIFLKLAKQADVLIENFRPGVVDELGFNYETVRKRNPKIIYCSISGFGQNGPYRDWPGYDTVGQAMGGLLSLITDLKNPEPIGVSLSDHITGIFACYGILAALYARERTGRGQNIETSLLQATSSFVQEGAARYFSSGAAPSRKTRVQTAQVYAFVAEDGLPFVVHLSSPTKFWHGLTQTIERPELREDPRFKDREVRIQNYEILHRILAEIFCTRPRKEWLGRLREYDVPSAPLYTLDEVFEDPQVHHLGMKVELNHPQKGLVRLSGNAIHLSGTPIHYRLAPPTLGEHTEEILKGLGYDDEAIERLRQQEIV